MKQKGASRFSIRQREQIHGYVFITPWILGLCFTFLLPLILSIVFSFSKVTMHSTGYKLDFIWFENFRRALLSDVKYPQYLVESIGELLYNVPVIIIFSFFVALLLKKPFPGAALAKAIFFLPVILSSGLFLMLQSNFGQSTTSVLDATIQNVSQSITVLKSVNMEQYLLEMGIPDDFISLITGPIDRIYEVISKSGIQIFIFLAGLNSISPSLYEAAHVEGGNRWETFWKITFPMMTPLLLVNMVYSIVDSFTSVTNNVMSYVYTMAFSEMNFGLSNAMSWMYLLILGIFMGIVFKIMSKRIFYYT